MTRRTNPILVIEGRCRASTARGAFQKDPTAVLSTEAAIAYAAAFGEMSPDPTKIEHLACISTDEGEFCIWQVRYGKRRRVVIRSNGKAWRAEIHQ